MYVSFSSYWNEDLVHLQTMRMKLPNVFGIAARNDVAVIVPKFEANDWVFGVLIGIEVKPEIDNHDITQAQMECLITAYNSNFLTVQVCLKLV